jgi:hypothetical protein
VNSADVDGLRVFHTDLFKLMIISPLRMHSWFGDRLAKLEPLVKLPNHLFLAITLIKFVIRNLGLALNDNWVRTIKFIFGYVFGFVKIQSEIYSTSDSPKGRGFEAIFLNRLSIFHFSSMKNRGSQRTMPRTMVRVSIFTNSTIVLSVFLIAIFGLAHLYFFSLI